MDKPAPQLPTAEDFHDPRFASGLDEASAERNFLGKTEAEAEAMFRRCFEGYEEDLASMGPRAFQFYARPALRYLMSPEAADDDGVPAYFCMLIDAWMHRDAEALRPVASGFIDVAEHLIRAARRRAEHQPDDEDEAYACAKLEAMAQKLRDLPASVAEVAVPLTRRERRRERRRR